MTLVQQAEAALAHVLAAPIDPAGMPSPEEERIEEAGQPRVPAGSSKGGQFASKGALGVQSHMADIPDRAQTAIHGRAAEMGIDQAAMTDRMVGVYGKATTQQLEAGKAWYGSAGDHAEATGAPYGISREQSAGVYAVLSPARHWDNNVLVGDAVLHTVGKNEPFDISAERGASARPPIAAGRYRPNELQPGQLAWTHPAFQGSAASSINHYRQVSSAIEIARGTRSPDLALTGPKTRSFYNNILNPRDHSSVTIDDWMYRTALGPDTTLTIGGTPRRVGDLSYGSLGSMMTRSPVLTGAGYPKGSGMYPLFADSITAGAARVGVSPAQFQAVVWTVARDEG